MKTKKFRGFSFKERASAYDNGIEGRASRKFYSLLLNELELEPGSAVLDVGCGTNL